MNFHEYLNLTEILTFKANKLSTVLSSFCESYGFKAPINVHYVMGTSVCPIKAERPKERLEITLCGRFPKSVYAGREQSCSCNGDTRETG